MIEIHNINKDTQEIVLNRPEKRNALNTALLEQFCSALENANHDLTIRTLVIRGNGTVFCAGMDLSEAADPQKVHLSTQLIAKMFSLITHSPHITIAAVHGAAIAGGAGIMAACDIAIAGVGTKFGFPETRRGLVPAQVMALLTRQIRQRDLRELLLLGELIEADKALAIGLINKVVPTEKLKEEILRYVGIVNVCAPGATTETKKLIHTLYPCSIDEDLSTAIHHHEKMRETPEAQEGIRAFLEGRPPEWGNQ